MRQSLPRTDVSVHCSLFVVRCSLFVVHCSLFIVRCTLFVVRRSLFVVRFVVRFRCSLHACTLPLIHSFAHSPAHSLAHARTRSSTRSLARRRRTTRYVIVRHSTLADATVPSRYVIPATAVRYGTIQYNTVRHCAPPYVPTRYPYRLAPYTRPTTRVRT